MFRGITFMVDGKMCISVGNNELMCRIDLELHDAVIEKPVAERWKWEGENIKALFILPKMGRQKRILITG